MNQIVGYSVDEFSAALGSMESSMEVGQHAAIALCSEALPAQEDLDDFYLRMVESGFHLTRPTASTIDGIPTTEFVLRKGSPFWPLLIGALPVIITGGLITFGIIKIEEITRAVMPLVLVTVGGLVVLAAVLRQPATAYIERGRL